MSYFSQMIGLTFQNFVSAAVGGAVAIALIRGLTRKDSKTIGTDRGQQFAEKYPAPCGSRCGG
jgi:K+-transporting ATPase A subunit